MKLKRFLSASVATSLFLCGTMFDSNALENDTSSGYESIPSYVQNVINDFSMGDVVERKNLLNSNCETIAYCLEFNEGYIIFNDELVIEFSDTEDSPYLNSDGNEYYCGPLDYFELTENGYTNLTTNENLEFPEFDFLSESFDEKNLEIHMSDNSIDIPANYSTRAITTKALLPGLTRKLNYNNDNTCGTLAIEIMLYYMYDNVSTNYIKTNLATNPLEFNTYLKRRLEPEAINNNNYGGSNPTALQTRFKTYYKYIWKSSEGIFTDFKLDTNPSWGFMYNIITTQGVPVVTGISNHPNYGNHWVVTYGVYHGDYPGDEVEDIKGYYVINDGWGAYNVYIEASYTDKIMYLC